MKVLLVDSSSVWYKAFFATQKLFPTDFNLPLAKEIFLEHIFEIKRRVNPDRIVLTLESPTNWRKKISPEYKANRSSMFDENTRQALRQFKIDMKKFMLEMCESTNIKCIEESDCEGDDIIAVAVMEHPEIEFTILASDKDFQQLRLHHNKLSQIATLTMKEYANEEYNLNLHIFIGDSADNIPGIKKGYGEKKASAILKEGKLESFLNDNGLNEVWERNKQLIDMKYIPQELVKKVDQQFIDAITKKEAAFKITGFVFKNKLSFNWINFY